jgi:cell division protein FtsB
VSRTAFTRPAPTSPSPSASARPRRRWIPRLRYLGLAIVCIWGTYYYFHVEQPRLNTLQQQQAQLQDNLNRLQQQHADLERQVRELHDKDYIARYAAQQFHLVAPGEVPFSVGH